jgi:hypothetical protein
MKRLLVLFAGCALALSGCSPGPKAQAFDAAFEKIAAQPTGVSGN